MKVSERLSPKCPTCGFSEKVTDEKAENDKYHCPYIGCIREDGRKICVERDQVVTKESL